MSPNDEIMHILHKINQPRKQIYAHPVKDTLVKLIPKMLEANKLGILAKDQKTYDAVLQLLPKASGLNLTIPERKILTDYYQNTITQLGAASTTRQAFDNFLTCYDTKIEEKKTEHPMLSPTAKKLSFFYVAFPLNDSVIDHVVLNADAAFGIPEELMKMFYKS